MKRLLGVAVVMIVVCIGVLWRGVGTRSIEDDGAASRPLSSTLPPVDEPVLPETSGDGIAPDISSDETSMSEDGSARIVAPGTAGRLGEAGISTVIPGEEFDVSWDEEGAATHKDSRRTESARVVGHLPVRLSQRRTSDAGGGVAGKGLGAVVGTVTLDLVPVPDAIITLRAYPEELVASTRTNEIGDYGIDSVPIGEIGIVAQIPKEDGSGLRYGQLTGYFEAGVTLRADFPFESESSELYGKVLVEDRVPELVDIRVWHFSSSGETRYSPEIDDEGGYAIPDIAPGSVRVQASALYNQKLRTINANIYLPAGESVEHDFLFTGGGTLTGTITNMLEGETFVFLYPAGTAFPAPRDITQEVFQELYDNLLQSISVFGDGVFEATNVPSGDYAVLAFSVPGTTGRPEEFRNGVRDAWDITIEDGQTTHIDFVLVE